MVSRRGTIDVRIDQGLDGLVHFWRWWRSELASLLPEGTPASLVGRLREQISPRSDVTLELAAEVLLTQPGGANSAMIGLVPESDLFRTKKSFPKAAKRNLREAIALQIEQLVPLERSAVQFGYRIADKAGTSDLFGAEIVIVEKERLDRMIQWAEANDARLETIQAPGVSNQGQAVVLWESERLAQKRTARRLNVLLVVLLAILVVSAGSALTTRWQTVEEEWAGIVREEQSRAAEARTLRETIDGLETRQRARIELHGASDLRRTLAILSEALPDGSHATRMEINGQDFRMEISSNDASGLESILTAGGRFVQVSVDVAGEDETGSRAAISVSGSVRR